MNVLPIVFMFLLLFAFLTHGLISDAKTFKTVAKAKIGYMQAQRITRNTIQSSSFKAIQSDPSRSKSPKKNELVSKLKPKEPQKPDLNSPRSEGTLSEPINIFSLFEKSTYSPVFYTICLNVLKTSYAPLVEASPQDIECIFHTIIKVAQKKLLEEQKKKTPLEFDWKDISFDENIHLSEIYYKMLRGTHVFQLHQSVGFPPMNNLFKVDMKTKRKPLYFTGLSQLMLRPVFGESIKEKILKKELSKKIASPKVSSYLKKEELETLLQTEMNTNQISELLKWIDFQSEPKPPYEKCIALDKETSITDERILLR